MNLKLKPVPNHGKSAGGTLLGLLIGLVLGVLIAAGVVWYMNKTPAPFVNRVQPAPMSGGPNQPPAPLPGKPGDPIPDSARTTPPPAARQSPENAVVASVPAPAPAGLPGTAGGERQGKPHYLQAGSFSQPQDAERLKANLALMGLEANVQQVMVQDKTYYRLMLGPYVRIVDANNVRADLAKAGIETVLVGNKE